MQKSEQCSWRYQWIFSPLNPLRVRLSLRWNKLQSISLFDFLISKVKLFYSDKFIVMLKLNHRDGEVFSLEQMVLGYTCPKGRRKIGTKTKKAKGAFSTYLAAEVSLNLPTRKIGVIPCYLFIPFNFINT